MPSGKITKQIKIDEFVIREREVDGKKLAYIDDVFFDGTYEQAFERVKIIITGKGN